VGADIETDPVEVAAPVGSPLPLNKAEFDKEIVAYYRGLANESATMLRVEEGRVLTGGTRPSKHIRLSHNVWVKRRRVTLTYLAARTVAPRPALRHFLIESRGLRLLAMRSREGT